MRSPWLVSPCLSPPLRSLFACQLFSIITASCAPSTCFVSPCGLQLAWPGAADDARPTLASFRNPEGGRFCCAGLSVLASVTEAPDRQRGSERAGGSQRGESLHGYVSLRRRSMEAGMETGVLGAEVCATLFSCPTAPHCSRGLWRVCALDATAEAMHTAGHSSSGRRRQPRQQRRPGRPQREKPWVCNNNRP